MCGIVVEGVMVHYIARRCDLAHVRAITLIADSPDAVCPETLICVLGGDEDVQYLSYFKSMGIHIVNM